MNYFLLILKKNWCFIGLLDGRFTMVFNFCGKTNRWMTQQMLGLPWCFHGETNRWMMTWMHGLPWCFRGKTNRWMRKEEGLNKGDC